MPSYYMKRGCEHLDQSIVASGEGQWTLSLRGHGQLRRQGFSRNTRSQKLVLFIKTLVRHHFGLTVLARANNQQPLQNLSFDLSHLLAAFTEDPAGDQPPQPNNPWRILRNFADQQDSAAQAAIGAYLAKQNRFCSSGKLARSRRASRQPIGAQFAGSDLLVSSQQQTIGQQRRRQR